VLDMSKIEAERFELQRGEFDAREAVTAAMRLLRVQADAAGVQLRGVLPPGELEVDADRRALKQIVLNLVSNALKFTPRGGQVTVTADGHDGEFELVVADTGVGISPEDLERLGRPYEQAGGVDQRAKGTGLGLSLVRAFAKLHGGEMHIESRLGAGTSVSVRMPVLQRPQSDGRCSPSGGAVAERLRGQRRHDLSGALSGLAPRRPLRPSGPPPPAGEELSLCPTSTPRPGPSGTPFGDARTGVPGAG
jgi:K+-sensing histidine kinase KdpD